MSLYTEMNIRGSGSFTDTVQIFKYKIISEERGSFTDIQI